MRIGIVGSGIAGLTSAWLFNRTGHDVTVFESQPELGLDAYSISAATGSLTQRVDVPPRMFSQSLWPNLCGLYRANGIAVEPVDASQSFGVLNGDTYLNLAVAYQPEINPKMLFDARSRLILNDARRFKQQAVKALGDGLPLEISLADYLRARRYSSAFVYEFLFPTLSSTVCTCSYQSLAQYPARILLEGLRDLSESRPLLRTKVGSAEVATKLASGLSDVRLETKVQAAYQSGHQVTVESTSRSGLKTNNTFEYLIVAVQANSAFGILSKMTEPERQMLGSFSYEEIPIVVHTDVRLMPSDTNKWATFNMINDAPPAQQHPTTGKSMCTIWMNHFCPEWDGNTSVFQTINPLIEPEPNTVLGTAVLQRPVVNQQSILGWAQLAQLMQQPDRRIWYCGSYSSYGIPLLESGVVSSLQVAKSLGVHYSENFSLADVRANA